MVGAPSLVAAVSDRPNVLALARARGVAHKVPPDPRPKPKPNSNPDPNSNSNLYPNSFLNIANRPASEASCPAIYPPQVPGAAESTIAILVQVSLALALALALALILTLTLNSEP